ncbi:hypothetical protein D8B26_000376 [Coccidioides posadasii str. Silveira]|uniref:Predicted protein n=1 Tax=Coccidioides posadasii (strain RMSCC 757 / Silveira) TaxID=443226 RepID=E9DF91_COCPS|nr:predicted protein [Coccidioides posadasii str. Silveira]QVM05670.1 hypothetical protein D8B26_000376 [Coccidioides posadasii str. Silveira]
MTPSLLSLHPQQLSWSIAAGLYSVFYWRNLSTRIACVGGPRSISAGTLTSTSTLASRNHVKKRSLLRTILPKKPSLSSYVKNAGDPGSPPEGAVAEPLQNVKGPLEEPTADVVEGPILAESEESHFPPQGAWDQY